MQPELAQQPVRFGTRALLLAALCVAAPGCISIPSLEKTASGVQGSATQVDRFAGLTVLRTASFVSGRDVVSDTEAPNEVRCGTKGLSAIVKWFNIDISSEKSAGICEAVIESAKFVDAIAAADEPPAREYTIYLVEWGRRYSQNSLSWFPFGSLKPTYVVYWYPNDLSRTRASAIDTVAHETTHIWSAIRSVNKVAAEDEEVAYTAGACARLHLTSQIRSVDLNWTELGGTNKEISNSATMGVKTSKALEPLFVDGIISVNTSAGRDYAESCERAIKSYLKLGDVGN